MARRRGELYEPPALHRQLSGILPALSAHLIPLTLREPTLPSGQRERVHHVEDAQRRATDAPRDLLLTEVGEGVRETEKRTRRQSETARDKDGDALDNAWGHSQSVGWY